MNYNINFYYISMQILAHITGPTGSGKTTI